MITRKNEKIIYCSNNVYIGEDSLREIAFMCYDINCGNCGNGNVLDYCRIWKNIYIIKHMNSPYYKLLYDSSEK